MSVAHTPAPWTAHNCDVRPTDGDDGKRFWDICAGHVHKSPCDTHVSGYIACPDMHVASVQFGNAEANARLIAAAPDMLAALEAIDLARHTDAPADWQRATDLSDAAIAKALGRTPNEIGGTE